MQILVIEDNLSDVQLLEMALTDAGLDHAFTVCKDGEEALAWIRACDAINADDLPRLAVVDLNLPKYDGIEVLREMRNVPALARVPALVLSSSASPKEITRIQEFSGAEYMRKPLDLNEYAVITKAACRILENAR